MKRQAISICLDTLKELEKQIKKEINDVEKSTKIKIKNKNRISILFPIVNYPIKTGKKYIYMSDSWKFENLKLKKQ